MSKKPLVVYIGHKRRTGKDTFAKLLAESLKEDGVTTETVAFTDSLKDHLSHLTDLTPEEMDIEKNNNTWFKCLRRKTLVFLGKVFKTPIVLINRELLINYGKGALAVHGSLLINHTRKRYEASKADVFIITDFRLPDEYFTDGITVKVVRNKKDLDVSDRSYTEIALEALRFNHIVYNYGSLYDLDIEAHMLKSTIMSRLRQK